MEKIAIDQSLRYSKYQCLRWIPRNGKFTSLYSYSDWKFRISRFSFHMGTLQDERWTIQKEKVVEMSMLWHAARAWAWLTFPRARFPEFPPRQAPQFIHHG
jgi:hypothetical protein